MSSTITLKEFKRKIKASGYKCRTHVYFGLGPHRHLEILDKNKNFVVGSGASVYTKKGIAKHKKAFALIRKYKGKVFDEKGDRVLF